MTSLGELAKDKKLNTSKSMLTYYASFGLIVPISTVGRMQIYDNLETREKIKLVERYKKQGLSLKQIKEIFDNEKNNS